MTIHRSADFPLVVITGAHGGIGSATARHFLDRGLCVLGLDLAPVPEALDGRSGYTHATVDVTDLEQLHAVAATAGPVSHLVAVAGGALPEEIAAPHQLPTPQVWHDSVTLNLTGAYHLLAAFEGNLQAADGNRSVTLVSSINAVRTYGLVAYSAAKAGLTGFMHALVAPLGAAGIRINTVLPGTVPTPRTIAEWAYDPRHFADLAATVPTGRLGTPDDVAAAITALAVDLTHVHGVALPVDGGQNLQA